MLVDVIELIRDELRDCHAELAPVVHMDLASVVLVRVAPHDGEPSIYNLIINNLAFSMRDRDVAVCAAQKVVDQVELAKERVQIEAQERMLALQKPLVEMIRDTLKDE